MLIASLALYCIEIMALLTTSTRGTSRVARLFHFILLLALASTSRADTELEAQMRRQYEKYPYPPYVPEQFRKILPIERLGDLHMTSQFIYGGKRDYIQANKTFRVLIAGCGTGTAMMYYGLQLGVWSPNAEIVCFDLSDASLNIAKGRYGYWKKHMSTVKVTFMRESIFNIPKLDLGQFDLINSIGVLMVTTNPDLALRILNDRLKPDGGMAIMVYAHYGRVGVYAMQEMMRQLSNASGDNLLDKSMVNMTQSLQARLPKTNQLVKDEFPGPDVHQAKYKLQDTLTVDDFLIAADLAYTVEHLVDWVHQADMRITAFYNPTAYSPFSYGEFSPTLKGVIEKMDLLKQAALAEKISNKMIKHVFYIVKSSNPVQVSTELDPEMVPFLRVYCTPNRAMEELKELDPITDGISYPPQMGTEHLIHFPLPELGREIVGLCDGHHTIQEIVDAIQADPDLGGKHDDVLEQVYMTVSSFKAMCKMTTTYKKLTSNELPYFERNIFKSCKWMGDLG